MPNPIELEYFGHVSRIGKAVSNAHRINLLYHLAQCERSVDTLANLTSLSIANTSQHLQTLRHAGLVTSRKEAQHVHYRLTDADSVVQLLHALQALSLGRIDEVGRLIDTHFDAREEYEPESKEVFLKCIEDGTLIALDVRPFEEFRAGHLTGAINIPLDHLDTEHQRLPNDRRIIVYCRGRYCLMSQDAVRRLRQRGIEAKRLCHGFPELRIAGYPVSGGTTEGALASATM